jgi:FkbM family methyltransferase
VVIREGAAAGLYFMVGPSSSVWASGKVEAPVQTALASSLRPGDVFFDVGAGLGFFTILGARLVGPEGTVVAFEPELANLESIRSNVEANGFGNVVVTGTAVSGETREGLVRGSGATARLTSTAPGVPVEIVSIDDFVAARPELVPAVVKIDVEGHELEVIRGMHETLARHRPRIVCELHGSNAEVSRELGAYGYALEVLEGYGSVEEAPGWVHVLATPAAAGTPC